MLVPNFGDTGAIYMPVKVTHTSSRNIPLGQSAGAANGLFLFAKYHDFNWNFSPFAIESVRNLLRKNH